MEARGKQDVESGLVAQCLVDSRGSKVEYLAMKFYSIECLSEENVSNPL